MNTNIITNIQAWWLSMGAKQRNWIVFSTLAILALGVISGDSLINIAIGTVGMCYVAVYSAGNTRWAFILGIIYVGIYTIICLQNRIMLDALQNVILIPIYFASFIHWGKAEVKPRNMTYNRQVYTFVGLAITIALLYLVSLLLNGNYSLLDSINTSCTLFAMCLGYYGFTENWICWTINNAISAIIFLLALFTPAGSITVFAAKLVFFINGLIGYKNFKKIGER